jgi:hypothetical protein
VAQLSQRIRHFKERGKVMLFQVFILSIVLGGIIGFLIGGFIEWDRATASIKELEDALLSSYREIDELHEHIHQSRR